MGAGATLAGFGTIGGSTTIAGTHAVGASPGLQTFSSGLEYLSTGVLAWERNELSYFDTTAHVVEILSGKASNAYKDFLRRKGISYLIAGEASVDLEAAVQKIGAAFGVDEIIVSGGGGLNWSSVQAGLCDEVSIVISPAADGTKGIQALFDADERYNRPLPTAFKLRAMQALDDGSAWLRYGVEGPAD